MMMYILTVTDKSFCSTFTTTFFNPISSTYIWKMGDNLIGPRFYSCYRCRNPVALHDDIVSKGFQSRNGRAFLFSHTTNVLSGPKEDRQLMTGLHMVADVHCSDCGEVLGWKYEKAYENSEKYKEGKVVLEKFKIVYEHR